MAIPLGAITKGLGKGIGKLKGLKGLMPKGKKLAGAPKPEEKPSRLSPEGLLMLGAAGLFDIVNILLAGLDIAAGVGTLIALIWNGIATIFMGGYLYFRTGNLPIKTGLKKVGLPFLGNATPVVRLVPWWIISVWTSCK